MKTDKQKAAITALRIMKSSLHTLANGKPEEPLKRCPNCRHRLQIIENFERCPKCHHDFTRVGRKTYIWDRSAGDPLPRSGVPSGEWVEWNLYEPEKVKFT